MNSKQRRARKRHPGPAIDGETGWAVFPWSTADGEQSFYETLRASFKEQGADLDEILASAGKNFEGPFPTMEPMAQSTIDAIVAFEMTIDDEGNPL